MLDERREELAGHPRREVDDGSPLDARPFAVRARKHGQHRLVRGQRLRVLLAPGVQAADARERGRFRCGVAALPRDGDRGLVGFFGRLELAQVGPDVADRTVTTLTYAVGDETKAVASIFAL